MEGKKTLEDAGTVHDSGRHYSPRLPTPDASRSSDTSERRGPTVSELLSFRPLVQDGVKVSSTRPSSQERSPPYRQHDETKPILPPLKMVIANAMNSPPETPRTDGASLQPSPREPSISSSLLFKPLAFYPNKKPRTEAQSWRNNSRRTSPGAPYPIQDQYYTSRRLSDSSNKRQRRYSLHTNFSGTSCCDSTERKPYYTFTGRPNSSGINTAFATETIRTTFDRLPISPASDTSYTTAAVPHVPSTHRSSYATLPAPSPEYEVSIDTFRRHAATETYRRPSYEQQRDYHHAETHASCRDTCHANQAAFFMPPHYDYSSGKSRKRSNLPKQSTEIMKNWFDNNIANPYPSEEQKATFSSLTGISMTQVSNWFINHRRRCPELREKRERVRTGGMLDN